MGKSIEEIYNLMYSPIVTPWNLLSNIKLDNYEYLNYSKIGNEIVAEMKVITNKGYTLYRYYFDFEDRLNRIEKCENDTEFTLFSREDELGKITIIEDLSKKKA